jgi:3',5'-cyclic AMP phosphodiesterase CpdA
MKTSESFTLAHLSDPHLTTPEGMRVRDFLGKRALGYLSWRRRRRAEHRGEILSALASDLERMRPDHVAVTGDLTQVGLPAELRQAGDWLRSLGDPASVSVVPGNHDVYVRDSRVHALESWKDYMTSDSGNDPRRAAFPFLRVRGSVALIGVSTAAPSAPFLATGRIGREQLVALEPLLGRAREAGLFRVLLMHHPACANITSRRKGLVDGKDLRAVIAGQGVELILHGHSHRCTHSTVAVPGGEAPAIGVPSSSAAGRIPGRGARYNLYTVRRDADGWQLEMTARRYLAEHGGFAHEATERLLPSVQAAHEDDGHGQDQESGREGRQDRAHPRQHPRVAADPVERVGRRAHEAGERHPQP